MQTITGKRVLDLLEEVVAEHGPETTYRHIVDASGDEHARSQYNVGDGCRYLTADGTKPLCIAGQVFARLGVTAALADKENSAVDSLLFAEPIDTDDEEDQVVLNSDALAVLRQAQACQDDGSSWGVALESASRAYRDLAL